MHGFLLIVLKMLYIRFTQDVRNTGPLCMSLHLHLNVQDLALIRATYIFIMFYTIEFRVKGGSLIDQ